MTIRTTMVRSEITFRLVLPGTQTRPVRTELSYDAGDPYAVQVGFHTGTDLSSDVVQWTFARQLLTDGLHRAVGDGDVRVRPSTTDGQQVVSLSLSSPAGRAVFEVPQAPLVEFLDRTYDAVPTGSEGWYVNVAADLALLLWADPGT